MLEPSLSSDRLLMNGIFWVVTPADAPLHDLWNAMILNGIVAAPGEEPPMG